MSRLDTVKSCIVEIAEDRRDFNQFFLDYILTIQDEIIDRELEFLLSRNDLDILKIDKLLNRDLDRLAMLHD